MRLFKVAAFLTRPCKLKNNPTFSMCQTHSFHRNSGCIKFKNDTLTKHALARQFHLGRHFGVPSSNITHGSTIFSLSSGHGKCGVAVVRVSGPRCKEVLRLIGRFRDAPSHRQAILRKLVHPATKEAIDRGIVLYFQEPESFTGEDCVEFQVHGGHAVISALLTALNQVPGCRQAEPGEFTKRAFLNGKLDLTEVEGLGDLIHAETEAQRRQALRQMEGELGHLYTSWTQMLTKCLAGIEAFIDFSEDQDIEEEVINTVNKKISKLISDISDHLDDDRLGERLRQGVQVVIVGEPNVGKSSLLNALCQRSAAIVTPIAGTTRDVIETALNIGGFPIVLSDTAGLRYSEDLVESEGIQRALDRCLNADLRVFMLDSSLVQEHKTEHSLRQFISNSLQSLTFDLNREPKRLMKPDQNTGVFSSNDKSETIEKTNNVNEPLNTYDNEPLNPYDNEPLNPYDNEPLNPYYNDVTLLHSQGPKLQRVLAPVRAKGLKQDCETVLDVPKEREVLTKDNTIIVLNKIDILNENELNMIEMYVTESRDQDIQVCPLSCLSKDGFATFVTVLKEKVESLCGDPLIGHPSLTQDRHRDHLQRCVQSLYRYRHMIEDNDIVLAAQCLRRGLRHLGSITGRVSSEDILDVIFRDFCIGK